MSQFRGDYDGKVTPRGRPDEASNFTIRDTLNPNIVEVIFHQGSSVGQTSDGRILGDLISFAIVLTSGKVRHFSGVYIDPCPGDPAHQCIQGMFVDFPGGSPLTVAGDSGLTEEKVRQIVRDEIAARTDPDDGGWTGSKPQN